MSSSCNISSLIAPNFDPKTIRFALQYDSKCLNSECTYPSIGAGVRFNAKKKVVGTYLESISIYEFTMKCPNCD